MKKTNIRAHRKGGSNAASPQVAKNTEPTQGKAQPTGKVNIDTWDSKGAALVLMTGSEAGPEDEIAGLNYSEAELQRIKAVAGDSASGLAEFLHSAIELRLQHGSHLSELYTAINQAAALHDLVEYRMFRPEDAQPSERIKCGVVELAATTFNRLRQAHEALNTLATLKGGAK